MTNAEIKIMKAKLKLAVYTLKRFAELAAPGARQQAKETLEKMGEG